jgi:DNA-directed RNA polymerase subunit RPC12/RpoP
MIKPVCFSSIWYTRSPAGNCEQDLATCGSGDGGARRGVGKYQTVILIFQITKTLLIMGIIDRIAGLFRKKPEDTNHQENFRKESHEAFVDIPRSTDPHRSEQEVREIPSIYRCRTCGKTFATEEELDNHHKSQKEQQNISESILQQENEEYTCLTCGKKFPNKLELEYHLKIEPEIHQDYGDKWDLMSRPETDDEKFLREQQDAIRKLNEIQIPVTKNCVICGKLDFPPFEGRDGKFYCREHILPENRGTGERGIPMSGSPGSIIYRTDGKTEFRQ